MQLFSEHLDKKKSLHKDLILYALSLEISFAHIIIIIFFLLVFIQIKAQESLKVERYWMEYAIWM